jgi:hypothetical protein
MFLRIFLKLLLKLHVVIKIYLYRYYYNSAKYPNMALNMVFRMRLKMQLKASYSFPYFQLVLLLLARRLRKFLSSRQPYLLAGRLFYNLLANIVSFRLPRETYLRKKL